MTDDDDKVFIENGKMTPQFEQWWAAVFAVLFAVVGMTVDNTYVRILAGVSFLACGWLAYMNHRIVARKDEEDEA